jgi:hypothetical protein
MIVLGTLRYVEEAYGSATEAVLKKLKPTHNRGIRFSLGAFAVSRTEKVLCEAGMTTITEMRKFSNTKATMRVVTNKEHPIRLFCINPSKIDEYAHTTEDTKTFIYPSSALLGTLQIDMRKIEITPKRPPWTTIDQRQHDFDFRTMRNCTRI